MSILQAIWNGPFFVGKLAQPVSVGDVLLKILEVLWRGLIAIVGLMLGTAAAIAGYVYVLTPMFFPPAKDSLETTANYTADNLQPPPLVKTVTGGAPAGPTREQFEQEPCQSEYPIRVAIFNKGNKPITKIRFYLEGYRPGFSANSLEQTWSFTTDVIIQPGQGWSNCYGARTKDQADPKKLNYKVDIMDAALAEK